VAGLVALVGGAEFTSGNEPQDERMVKAATRGPAYVVSTAAARQGRGPAVAHARRWFSSLGLELEELPVLSAVTARDPELTQRAADGGFFYLLGGDPGLVVDVLRDSPVWGAMVGAWQRGAVLAGSSAGAMGMCASVLLRAAWPDRSRRRHTPGLGLIPACAVIPHFDTFGGRWIVPSARGKEAGPAGPWLIGIDERTAAVWDGARWSVEGPGTVTMIAGEDRRVHGPGDSLGALPAPLMTTD